MHRKNSALVTGPNLEQVYNQINALEEKRLVLERKLTTIEPLLSESNIVYNKLSSIPEVRQLLSLIEKLIAKRNNILLTYKNIKREVVENITKIANQIRNDNELTKNYLYKTKITLEKDFKIYLENTEKYLLSIINGSITYLFSLEKREKILDPLISGHAAITDNLENFKIHHELRSTIESLIRDVTTIKLDPMDVLYKILNRDKLRSSLEDNNNFETISKYLDCYNKQSFNRNFISNIFFYRPSLARKLRDEYTNERLDVLPELIKLYYKHQARKHLPQYRHKFNILAACLSYLFCIDVNKEIFLEKSKNIDALFIEDKEINEIANFKNVLIENNSKTKTCLLYQKTKELFNKDEIYEKGKLDLCLMVEEFKSKNSTSPEKCSF